MKDKTILLIASGDLRSSANQNCWAEQEAMEADLCKLANSMGYTIQRAHAYDPVAKHGFISSQRQGMDIFSKIDACEQTTTENCLEMRTSVHLFLILFYSLC